MANNRIKFKWVVVVDGKTMEEFYRLNEAREFVKKIKIEYAKAGKEIKDIQIVFE
jgi:hypothetical protein